MRSKICLVILVLVAGLFSAEYRLLRPQKLEIPAGENLTINATYYPVVSTPNNSVILIHALGRNRGDWNELAKYLQKEGISALSFDMRGHGESIASDGRPWRLFQENEYLELSREVDAVYGYAIQQLHFQPARTGLVGMGIGANLALQLAENNPNIAGVVLISPGMDFKGVLLKSNNYKKSLYVICSKFEEVSVEAGEYLKKTFTGKIKLDIYDSGGTLVSLFRKRFTIPDSVSDWFKQVFAG